MENFDRFLKKFKGGTNLVEMHTVFINRKSKHHVLSVNHRFIKENPITIYKVLSQGIERYSKIYVERHRGKHNQNSPEEVIKVAHSLPDIKIYSKAIIIKEVQNKGIIIREVLYILF